MREGEGHLIIHFHFLFIHFHFSLSPCLALPCLPSHYCRFLSIIFRHGESKEGRRDVGEEKLSFSEAGGRPGSVCSKVCLHTGREGKRSEKGGGGRREGKGRDRDEYWRERDIWSRTAVWGQWGRGRGGSGTPNITQKVPIPK